MGISVKMEILMGMVLLSIVYLVSINLSEFVVSDSLEGKDVTVVIDAGHGGNDPGKISVTKELEKNINLEIALLVKELLEEEGVNVIMTRETDRGLYAETDSNKKSADMKARCKLVNESNAIIAVSIHQNSYSSENAIGAQVFYYSESEEGQKLAHILQQALIDGADTSNKRKAKSNSNYYMLLHTDCPTVIVECGFLSNWEEAKKLESEEYQRLIAESITKGIVTYAVQTTNH